MTYIKLLLVVLVIAASVQLAHSQDDTFLLNHTEIGKHERPLVEFNHKLHAEKLDCIRCHHDFDAFLNNRGGEGQTCDSCHKKKADDDLLSLKEAFHIQCIACHDTLKKGPVTCGECHVRK
ncbi:MAG: cytochrome c3 family protein [Syntrophobacteraceae bacterium]